MTLKIIKKTETTEDVDLQLPAYFNNWGWACAIKENGVIVKVTGELMAVLRPEGKGYYQETLAEVLASKPITEEQFNAQVKKFFLNAASALEQSIEFQALQTVEA